MFTRHPERRPTARREPVTLYPYALRRAQRRGAGLDDLSAARGPDRRVRRHAAGRLQISRTCKPRCGPRPSQPTGGWLGFTDKYWLTALIPDQKEQVNAQLPPTRRSDRPIVYQVDYRGAEHDVAPGATRQHRRSRLRRRQGSGAARPLRDAARHPALRSRDRFRLVLLAHQADLPDARFLLRLIGNFGLAIMLLTVIIKLLFFPLANKSYRAMSKMKLLQPEMAKLREQVRRRQGEAQPGDDGALQARRRQSDGGLPADRRSRSRCSSRSTRCSTSPSRCARRRSMAGSTISRRPTRPACQSLRPAALRRRRRIALPASIGAWPLIMGITMFLQQKLNPQPRRSGAGQDVHGPAARLHLHAGAIRRPGLVIYWAWNNLLSIAQQWVIMHRAASRADAARRAA